MSNITVNEYLLYKYLNKNTYIGLTETRTRVGGFKVLSDNQLHYKTDKIVFYIYFLILPQLEKYP